MAGRHQESTLTVVLAPAANLGIAPVKTVAAVITGSESMASEAGSRRG